MEVPTLLVSGTVGSGKSTVATAISEILSQREVAHVVLDLDVLLQLWSPTASWDDLLFANLASLWSNYAAQGIDRLVLAHVLEDPADLERYRQAVPGAAITVCRLLASRERRISRLESRMQPGPSLEWHVERTGELEAILDSVSAEDFAVSNDDRPVGDVALEVLRRAGW